MREHWLNCQNPSGTHQLHYQEWGNPHNPEVIICVHGLTRNCHDFDFIAERLHQRFRVICPDLPGRGQSSHLSNPAHYCLEQYLQDLTTLLAHVNTEQVHWLGTSLGGLLGIAMAAQPDTRVKSLVLNDIGPYLPKESVTEIADALQAEPVLQTRSDLAEFHRQIYQDLGDLPDSFWQHLTDNDHQQLPDGQFRRNYDLQIIEGLRQEHVDNDRMWESWLAVQCPIYVLRGAESPLFPPELLEKMLATKSGIEVTEFPGIGHPVSLAPAHEIEPVLGWLERRLVVAV